MSLDQRCEQYHDAAMGVSKTKGPSKEIMNLRKFLHNNQDQRFTDKAISRLFDTIQIYCNHNSTNAPSELKEGLLEDALKMPFTVFNTKQKQKMLKMLEELRGKQNIVGEDESDGRTFDNTMILSIIECDARSGTLSLMDEESGTTFESVPLPVGTLGERIVSSFDATESVVLVKVILQRNAKNPSVELIVDIIEQD